MVVLKKVKAATLMETMVATVLIVVLFMMASLIINSLMAAQAKSNMGPIKEHLNLLEYELKNGIHSFPYYEDWNGWEIIAEENKGNGLNHIKIRALKIETNQSLTSTLSLYDLN